MPKVTELYCYVISGTDDDDEGIPAAMTPLGVSPLVVATKRVLNMLQDKAQLIADQTGKPLRVYKFVKAEQIGEVTPRKKDDPDIRPEGVPA